MAEFEMVFIHGIMLAVIYFTIHTGFTSANVHGSSRSNSEVRRFRRANHAPDIWHHLERRSSIQKSKPSHQMFATSVDDVNEYINNTIQTKPNHIKQKHKKYVRKHNRKKIINQRHQLRKKEFEAMPMINYDENSEFLPEEYTMQPSYYPYYLNGVNENRKDQIPRPKSKKDFVFPLNPLTDREESNTATQVDNLYGEAQKLDNKEASYINSIIKDQTVMDQIKTSLNEGDREGSETYNLNPGDVHFEQDTAGAIEQNQAPKGADVVEDTGETREKVNPASIIDGEQKLLSMLQHEIGPEQTIESGPPVQSDDTTDDLNALAQTDLELSNLADESSKLIEKEPAQKVVTNEVKAQAPLKASNSVKQVKSTPIIKVKIKPAKPPVIAKNVATTVKAAKKSSGRQKKAPSVKRIPKIVKPVKAIIKKKIPKKAVKQVTKKQRTKPKIVKPDKSKSMDLKGFDNFVVPFQTDIPGYEENFKAAVSYRKKKLNMLRDMLLENEAKRRHLLQMKNSLLGNTQNVKQKAYQLNPNVFNYAQDQRANRFDFNSHVAYNKDDPLANVHIVHGTPMPMLQEMMPTMAAMATIPAKDKELLAITQPNIRTLKMTPLTMLPWQAFDKEQRNFPTKQPFIQYEVPRLHVTTRRQIWSTHRTTHATPLPTKYLVTRASTLPKTRTVPKLKVDQGNNLKNKNTTVVANSNNIHKISNSNNTNLQAPNTIKDFKNAKEITSSTPNLSEANNSLPLANKTRDIQQKHLNQSQSKDTLLDQSHNITSNNVSKVKTESGEGKMLSGANDGVLEAVQPSTEVVDFDPENEMKHGDDFKYTSEEKSHATPIPSLREPTTKHLKNSDLPHLNAPLNQVHDVRPTTSLHLMQFVDHRRRQPHIIEELRIPQGKHFMYRPQPVKEVTGQQRGIHIVPLDSAQMSWLQTNRQTNKKQIKQQSKMVTNSQNEMEAGSMAPQIHLVSSEQQPKATHFEANPSSGLEGDEDAAVAKQVIASKRHQITTLPMASNVPTETTDQTSFQVSSNPSGQSNITSQGAPSQPATWSSSSSVIFGVNDQMNLDDLYWTDSSEEKEKICKEQKGTNEVVHVMCFGDSLTRGYYNKGKSHHPYTNKLELLLNKLDSKRCFITDNEGKDGDLASGKMGQRLEAIYKQSKYTYDWVIILGGTNDIYNKMKTTKVTADELARNIFGLHQIAHNHGTKTVAVTIPEIFCETQETCHDVKQVREDVNQKIRQYAYDHHDKVVLSELAGKLSKFYNDQELVGQFFEGGLHLKPRGYERMALIIFEALKNSLD